MDFYALSYAANTKTLPYARVIDIGLRNYCLSLNIYRLCYLSI